LETLFLKKNKNKIIKKEKKRKRARKKNSGAQWTRRMKDTNLIRLAWNFLMLVSRLSLPRGGKKMRG
jgi:hypothetical protein